MTTTRQLDCFKCVAGRTIPGEVPPRVTGRLKRAFTLVEMLVVMALMVLLLSLLIPAFNAIGGAGGLTKAAYDISGALEQARTYAMANNTYVWVGFFEEDGSVLSPSANVTEGVGRVVVSIVASKTGIRYRDTNMATGYPSNFGKADPVASPTNPVTLTQLGKLMKFDQIHMVAVNNGTAVGNVPPRPPVRNDYQVGKTQGGGVDAFSQHIGTNATGNSQTVANATTFTYPIPPSSTRTAANPQYTFTKIIEFNPQGEASKICENTFTGPGAPSAMELAFQPAHGSVIDARYAGASSSNANIAIQIEGLTGRVQIFRQ